MSETESENVDRQAPAQTESENVERRAPEQTESSDLVGRAGQEDPDVYLDVPKLEVDEITLEVENLRAKVSLQVEVLDMVKLSVGADVELGKVNLGIRGVQAQALLKVHLKHVAQIVHEVLRTVDNNPELVKQLATTVEDTAARTASGLGNAVGESAKQLGSGGSHQAIQAGSTVQHARQRGEQAAHAAGRYARTAGKFTRIAASSARSKAKSLSGKLRHART